jgi:hypothetical protein
VPLILIAGVAAIGFWDRSIEDSPAVAYVVARIGPAHRCR